METGGASTAPSGFSYCNGAGHMKRTTFIMVIACLLISATAWSQGKKGPDNQKKNSTDDPPKTQNQLDDNMSGTDNREYTMFQRDEREPVSRLVQIRGGLDKIEKLELSTTFLMQQVKKGKPGTVDFSDKINGLLQEAEALQETIGQVSDLLPDSERKAVEPQLRVLAQSSVQIMKSCNLLSDLLTLENNDRDKLNKTLGTLQKELNRVTRQFRAIEWILSSE
jgi:hypothetical protein